MIQSSNPVGCRDNLEYGARSVDLVPVRLNPPKAINDIIKLIPKRPMSTWKGPSQMISLKMSQRNLGRAFPTRMKGLR